MTVHFVQEGPADGEVVVLSGSLGSDLAMWDPQVAPLVAAGYRVVRHDLRGHGGSPVPPGPYTLDDLGGDALWLLDELGAERVHWVGLSLGGMIGMWLGAHAPRRLRTLSLCCTSASMEPRSMWAERAERVRATGTAPLAEAAVDRWFTPSWRAAHPDEVARYRRMVAATPAEGYAGCCEAIGTMRLLDVLPALSTPTLVLCGAEDPGAPAEGHGARIAEAVPRARLVVVESAAHLGTAEQPERFTSLILDHLGHR